MTDKKLPAKQARSVPRNTFDFEVDAIPKHVREIISAHLAIEAEAAKEAGALGFMARALTIATMPHSKQLEPNYERKNGDFLLSMASPASIGLPYGALARVLVAWVSTEAVKTQTPEIVLGDNLAEWLKELGLHRSGGPRGDITRVREQMRRLFACSISAIYSTPENPWAIENIQLVRRAKEWWDPQHPGIAGGWRTTLHLNQGFYEEVTQHPVPVDLRAFKALRRSPLAIDIYTWLTYRYSYLKRRTPLIRWEAVHAQFGAGYDMSNDQSRRDFKTNFLKQLKLVQTIYPQARLQVVEDGMHLLPSRPHVPQLAQPRQGSLW